jgi:hypothetical protein
MPKLYNTPPDAFLPHVFSYIQVHIISDKSKTLHPATVDDTTDGVSFVMPGRETPIAFDKKRHRLVHQEAAEEDAEDSEDEDGLQLRPTTATSFPARQLIKKKDLKAHAAPAKRQSLLKFNVSDPLAEEEAEEEEAAGDKNEDLGGRKRRATTKKTITYADDGSSSDEDEEKEPNPASDSESSAEDETEKNLKRQRRSNKESSAHAATTKSSGKSSRSATLTSSTRTRRSLSPDMRIEEDSDDGSIYGASRDVAAAAARESFGGGGDWRTFDAVDY